MDPAFGTKHEKSTVNSTSRTARSHHITIYTIRENWGHVVTNVHGGASSIMQEI